MLISSLEENYNNIIEATEKLMAKELIPLNSIKSLRMLVFKIKYDNKEQLLEVINQQFNDFGETKETAVSLFIAKKTKLENIFKKNLNFL